MGHRVAGSFRVRDQALFNDAVEAAWGMDVKVCPHADDPKVLEYELDSDDEQKLISALAAVNKKEIPVTEPLAGATADDAATPAKATKAK